MGIHGRFVTDASANGELKKHCSESWVQARATVGGMQNRIAPLDSRHATTSSTTHHPARTSQRTAVAENLKLVVSRGSMIVEEVRVRSGLTTVGRGRQNDIVLDDPEISNYHLHLQCTATEVLLKDLRSTNGTFVNGVRIASCTLHYDDEIRVGPFRLRCRAAGTSLPSVDLNKDRSQVGFRILSGQHLGRFLYLSSESATYRLSRATAQIQIERRAHGYLLRGITGPVILNGATLGANPQLLHEGDRLDVNGTLMCFVGERRSWDLEIGS